MRDVFTKKDAEKFKTELIMSFSQHQKDIRTYVYMLIKYNNEWMLQKCRGIFSDDRWHELNLKLNQQLEDAKGKLKDPTN